LTFALERRSRSIVNNSEQFGSDRVGGSPKGTVDDLRAYVGVVSTLAWPISCAMTFPGTPF